MITGFSYGNDISTRSCQTSDFSKKSDVWLSLNDEGQLYLYAHELFIVVDAQEPANWETEYGEAGERYAYPPELNEPGFFEDYLDGKTEAIITFHRYLQRSSARRQILAESL